MPTVAKRLSLALIACLPLPAGAHPHVFIDAGLDLMFGGGGRLVAVQVVSIYDEFNSLLIVADRGWDPMAPLDAAQRRELAAFDTDWAVEFGGDLQLRVGEDPVALARPERPMADYRQGRVISVHLRRLETPVDPADAPVLLQVYDPSFYTHYRLAVTPRVHGREDCGVTLIDADRNAADERLAAALADLRAAGKDVEQNFPAVGASYAATVRLSCGTGS